MSVTNKKNTIERIKYANRDSKILVYGSEKEGFFDSYFSSTIASNKLDHTKKLIGEFYGEHGCRDFIRAVDAQ